MNALLVVEDAFLDTHVGVRRVIFHYWRELVLSGWDVTLASPDRRGGLWRRSASPWGPAATEAIVMAGVRTTAPEGKPLLGVEPAPVSPGAFELVVASAPWVLAVVPDLRPDVGIVYDIVPNLLAIGALRFPRYVHAGYFAQLHDRGLRLMAAAQARISCISRSTMDDVLDAYRSEIDPALTAVDVPFDVDRMSWPASRTRNEGMLRIALVNALDFRKGPFVAVDALSVLAARREISLSIVGPGRMGHGEDEAVLQHLRSLAVEVTYTATASDRELTEVYASADVLLFPSHYEGLGLPVLEAQASGTPVVTCSYKGGGEFNINALTALDSDSKDDVAEAVIRAADDERVMRGVTLRLRLSDALADAKNPWWRQVLVEPRPLGDYPGSAAPR